MRARFNADGLEELTPMAALNEARTFHAAAIF